MIPDQTELSGCLASITVTYHPELDILGRQLRALPAEAVKIIVDNNSGDETRARINSLVKDMPQTFFLPQLSNLGLAAGLDVGVRSLSDIAPDRELILLLDQDSEPRPGAIARLCGALIELERSGKNPGAVGPQLQDVDTGLYHGFHQMTRWRWRRVFPEPPQQQPISIANLNGSGTLMRRAVYERLGGLDSELFIDHVDTEWAFRLLVNGYTLWGIPDAVFLHRMGQRGLRFWMLGWRVWPARSPARHRYLYRNALWLIQRPYVPQVWKFWAVIKLLLTALMHGLADPHRLAQLAAMWQGVREGMHRTTP